MIMYIFLGAWLFLLAFFDVRKRAVPLRILVIGMCVAAAYRGYLCLAGEMLVPDILKDFVPGLSFLLIAVSTKKAGCGDGLVLIVLGAVLGHKLCVYVLTIALVLGAIVSLVLLLFKKVKGNTELPFLPFLGLGYIVCLTVGK